MTRDELKNRIDDLMRQYDKEEIDKETYTARMAELIELYRNENQADI